MRHKMKPMTIRPDRNEAQLYGLKPARRNGVLTPARRRELDRERLEKDVEEFLARGNTITKLPGPGEHQHQ